jgi:hypothetical protein
MSRRQIAASSTHKPALYSRAWLTRNALHVTVATILSILVLLWKSNQTIAPRWTWTQPHTPTDE